MIEKKMDGYICVDFGFSSRSRSWIHIFELEDIQLPKMLIADFRFSLMMQHHGECDAVNAVM